MTQESAAQARASMLAIREQRYRSAIKKLSDKMIERKGVARERGEIIYQLLKTLDMPLTAKEIAQMVGLPIYLVNGTAGPIELLLAEGRIGRANAYGARYAYYADPDLSESLTEHAPMKDI